MKSILQVNSLCICQRNTLVPKLHSHLNGGGTYKSSISSDLISAVQSADVSVTPPYNTVIQSLCVGWWLHFPCNSKLTSDRGSNIP